MRHPVTNPHLIFEHACKYSSIGITIVSPTDGTWLNINPAMCRMLGYTEEELLCKTFYDVTYPEDRPKSSYEMISAQLLKGEHSSIHEFEKRYVHKSGRIVWASLHVSLVRDEQTGEPLYCIAQAQTILGCRSGRRAGAMGRQISAWTTGALTEVGAFFVLAGVSHTRMGNRPYTNV